MRTRIHRLDSLTIDKIAAGEVVDAPASCVKELIDNSLDAGATDVLIEICLGGRERIRVTDNGCGMVKEDVVASIERHATSKLQYIEDLERLTSRGFRGEALPSIVAISKTTVTSAENDGVSTVRPATVLKVEGGTVVSVTETMSLPGTCVEVCELFFNIPARRKFLKSPAKDTQEILKAVTLLALAAPHVSFKLIADGNQVLKVDVARTDTLLNRIRDLLGDPFRKESYEVAFARDGFTLQGILGAPRHARSSRTGQYLIVNNRPVVSLPISYAVRGAYGTTCENSKHPLYALHLGLDPSTIDINVHPQKKEIRLADDEWVKMLIHEAIAEALFGKKSFSYHAPCAVHNGDFTASEERKFNTEKTGLKLDVETIFSGIRPGISAAEKVDSAVSPGIKYEAQSFLFPSREFPTKPTCVTVLGDVAIMVPPRATNCPIPADHLLVLDIKQAMRAVIAAELKNDIGVTDLLLIPITIELSVQEAALVSLKLPFLESLGFVIRSFGPTSFLVEGLPARLLDVDVPKLIFDLVHEESQQEQLCKRLACHYVASIRALRSPISTDTAVCVYERWAQQEYPHLAPDGSPCFSSLTGSILKEIVAKGWV